MAEPNSRRAIHVQFERRNDRYSIEKMAQIYRILVPGNEPSSDNYKLRIRTFQKIYRLLSLETFFVATHASIHRSLSRGSSSRSRPATETVTPVNLWN